jgi:SLIDE
VTSCIQCFSVCSRSILYFFSHTHHFSCFKHEYERVTNAILKGEKKIAETMELARAVRILVSIFDNPWEELEFNHVNASDKLFSMDNDRYLLCWTHKVSFFSKKLISCA